MDESMFDLLLRRAAEQTTRRRALGALVGGALLRNALGETEANDKAKRRRKRRRRQAKRSDPFLRPIKVRISNPGPRTIEVVTGGYNDNIVHWECVGKQTHRLYPGSQVQFDTTKPVTDGFAWIDGKYAIEFWNPFLKRPAVSAAANGMSVSASFCPPRGTRAVLRRPLKQGQTSEFRIYDKVFVVTRNADTNYIEFTLTLPANL